MKMLIYQLIHEDELPHDEMTEAEYATWFKWSHLSEGNTGVRIGPRVILGESVEIPRSRFKQLMKLAAAAMKAATCRQREEENENYSLSGPLEYDAEAAESELIRYAREFAKEKRS